MNLTDKSVRALALPKGKREAIYFDDSIPGFGVRLRTNGPARWVFQYRIGRKQRRLTLGATTAIPMARARQTSSELYAKTKLGRDPQGERSEGRLRAIETVAATIDAYLAARREELRERSFSEVSRHLNKYARSLHRLQIGKVDRRTVASLINRIAVEHGPPTANRVRASLSALFAWAIRSGLVEQNPVVGSERREEKSRERVLSDLELRAIWTATAGDDDFSAVIRLAMLTACRRTELGSLRWSEVQGDAIALPSERVKNGKAHTLPLSPVAQAILDKRPHREDRDYIFGSRPGTPLTGWSAPKKALDERIRATGMKLPKWTLHDLRRTVATKLADLGIRSEIIEAILNHYDGHRSGAAGVYNRSKYTEQMRAALETWAEHLLAIVEGRQAPSNLVQLRA